MFGFGSQEAKMPDVTGCEYLLDMFLECGVVMPDGGSLTYGEIGSWASITGLNVTSYEAITIRKMSCSYALQSTLSRNTTALDPCFSQVNDIEEVRANVIRKKNAARGRKS